LETIKQNFENIQQMMECQVPVSELRPEELRDKGTHVLVKIDSFINPFKFQHRRLKVGQWIDMKDTIDQWVHSFQASNS
jgi:hypothetical protein